MDQLLRANSFMIYFVFMNSIASSALSACGDPRVCVYIYIITIFDAPDGNDIMIMIAN